MNIANIHYTGENRHKQPLPVAAHLLLAASKDAEMQRSDSGSHLFCPLVLATVSSVSVDLQAVILSLPSLVSLPLSLCLAHSLAR